MRIWVQVFSSPARNPDFHGALADHLRSVAEPSVALEVHGTRKGGLGEQFRFFQALDTPDILENVLKCRAAKGEGRYDAFVQWRCGPHDRAARWHDCSCRHTHRRR